MYGKHPRQQRMNVRQRAMPSAVRPRGGGLSVRLIIGLVMAGFALFSYFKSSSVNPVTGEKQYINISSEQEIALGLQAAPQMAQQHGGLHPSREGQAMVDRVGQKLVQNSAAKDLPYQYDFHLLADAQSINAFALPGGQMFITAALYQKLETEGQLAGVLGHELGHVVARHGAQRISKQQLTQGLSGAVVLATYDPNNPASQGTAQVAMMIGNLVNMKYGRDDELESDELGVVFMSQAGYDPRAMAGVMRILEEAGGGGRQPEFMSTHPSPENRVQQIEATIQKIFPNGVPGGLQP